MIHQGLALLQEVALGHQANSAMCHSFHVDIFDIYCMSRVSVLIFPQIEK